MAGLESGGGAPKPGYRCSARSSKVPAATYFSNSPAPRKPSPRTRRKFEPAPELGHEITSSDILDYMSKSILNRSYGCWPPPPCPSPGTRKVPPRKRRSPSPARRSALSIPRPPSEAARCSDPTAVSVRTPPGPSGVPAPIAPPRFTPMPISTSKAWPFPRAITPSSRWSTSRPGS